MPDKLVQLHIPKTGGITLRKILRYFYRHEDTYVIRNVGHPRIPAETRLLVGHVPWGAVEPGPKTIFVTMLREPAARLCSYYEMCKTSRPEVWPLYGQFWRDGQPMPLLDFAAGGMGMRDQIDNAMVRQLCGWRVLVHPGPVTERDYRQARHNLEQCLVGLTEEFDAFLRVLAHRFDWIIPSVSNENVSFPYTYPDSILDELRGLNPWDVKLYGDAQRFWQRHAANGAR